MTKKNNTQSQKSKRSTRKKRALQARHSPLKAKMRGASMAGMKKSRKAIRAAAKPGSALASALGQVLALPMDHSPLRLPEPGKVRYTATLSLNATE